MAEYRPPHKIYLSWEGSDLFYWYPDQQKDADYEYISATRAASLQAEVERLREALEAVKPLLANMEHGTLPSECRVCDVADMIEAALTPPARLGC